MVLIWKTTYVKYIWAFTFVCEMIHNLKKLNGSVAYTLSNFLKKKLRYELIFNWKKLIIRKWFELLIELLTFIFAPIDSFVKIFDVEFHVKHDLKAYGKKVWALKLLFERYSKPVSKYISKFLSI